MTATGASGSTALHVLASGSLASTGADADGLLALALLTLGTGRAQPAQLSGPVPWCA